MNYYREVFKVMADQSKIERRLYQLIEKTEIVERYSKQDTMEINGIPDKSVEDLYTIVMRLITFLSCEIAIDDIQYTKRIRNRRPRPFIVRFTNRRIRDRLINAVTRFNQDHPNDKLNTKHLGFKGSKRPVLLSSYPSRLNEIHRDKARNIVRLHRKAGFTCGVAREALRLIRCVKQVHVKTLRALSLSAVNKKIIEPPKPVE